MLSTPQVARGLPINRDFAPSNRERKPHQTSDFLGRFFAVRTGRGASSESSVRTACRLAFPSVQAHSLLLSRSLAPVADGKKLSSFSSRVGHKQATDVVRPTRVDSRGSINA